MVTSAFWGSDRIVCNQVRPFKEWIDPSRSGLYWTAQLFAC